MELYWNYIVILLLEPDGDHDHSWEKAPVQDVTAIFAINSVNGDMNGFFLCFQHHLQAAVIKAYELH